MLAQSYHVIAPDLPGFGQTTIRQGTGFKYTFDHLAAVIDKEKSNYNAARTAFIKHLERHANTGDPGLESVRWIRSSLSADQLTDDLMQKLDKNDRLFVSKLRQGEYQGLVKPSVWDWIRPKV